ncbi:MAG TPA: hypothetical protein VGH28_20005, partial [Polyangiaceae bacterium]
MQTLCRNLSKRLVVGLIGALHAAEKFAALGDMASLEKDGRGKLALFPHTHERNVRTLYMFSFATLYEAIDALERLRGAGVAAKVGKDFEAWKGLDEMRKTWSKNRVLAKLRHAFGSHLDFDEIDDGLDRIKNGHPVVLIDFRDGRRVKDATFPIVLEVQRLPRFGRSGRSRRPGRRGGDRKFARHEHEAGAANDRG